MRRKAWPFSLTFVPYVRMLSPLIFAAGMSSYPNRWFIYTVSDLEGPPFPEVVSDVSTASTTRHNR